MCEDIFNKYKNNKDKPYVFTTPEELLFWAHRQYLGKYNETTLKEFKKEMENYNFGFRENGTIKYIEELKQLFEHKIDTTLDGTKKINAIYKVLYKYRKDYVA